MFANGELIGLFAGILTTLAFLPLVIKVLKTKSTTEYSNGWLILSLTGLTMWSLYGVVLKSIPVIFFNFVSLIFVTIIVVYKLSSYKISFKVGPLLKKYNFNHVNKRI